MVSSFDIFDTCLVRKCGTSENFFDVLSMRAFKQDPPEWARQEFIVTRKSVEQKLWQENPRYTIQDIWEEFDWSHQFLKSKKELCQLEQDLEREMLVPVLSMREKVNECRKKGDKIVFISDMYLSTEFLTDVMCEHGFYREGDSLYVSCECGATKWNGDLFQHVKSKEGMSSYRHWHHYGDNKRVDYIMPKKLGIRCTLIKHEYTPYQQQWIDNDYSLGYKYPSILAGIGRALRYSTEWTTHTDFVLDIIAPFYCSWIYQVLEDAQKKGIKRLYFCARDAYQIHKIALAMQPYFPEVGIEYVYMSRVALYNEDNEIAKLAYFKYIGLATKDNVAIVDTTTSGKTLMVLNAFLKKNGYNEATAYYFLLWNKVEGINRAMYNVQVYDAYETNRNAYMQLYALFEIFFALNNEQSTADYAIDNGIAKPVFSQKKMADEIEIKDRVDWVTIHSQLLVKYAQSYVDLHLARFSKRIFESIGLKCLVQFYDKPMHEYVMALANMYIKIKDCDRELLFVRKIYNPMCLVGPLRDFVWLKGSLFYSYSEKVSNLVYRFLCLCKLMLH